MTKCSLKEKILKKEEDGKLKVIWKKIEREFLNKALILKINDILEFNNIMWDLEKFPQNLVCDVAKKSNKDLIDMALEQIFKKKNYMIKGI